MADFKIALEKLLDHEGVYSNDPTDKGGETFCGISRRFYPSWEGWFSVDSREYDEAQKHVPDFYRNLYWNKFRGDEIPNQAIAEELLESAVNLGLTRAIEFLQKSLNLLNRNQKSWVNILEDGRYGNWTHATLIKALNSGDGRYVLKVLNILQGSHYIAFMGKDEEQERFARGWLERVSL